MTAQSHRIARVVSVIAATLTNLACGTNYAYSVWAPQFAQRLNLSSTQSNIIGLSGNYGLYLSGFPFGMMIDAWGVRLPSIIGSVCLAAGYFSLRAAYNADAGPTSVPLLCFFSILTGLGGAAGSNAALKTSALNFPNSRGTATAFPMAAFGLSAFFFSTISAWAFPNDTSALLLFLATATSLLSAVCCAFLRIFPAPRYSIVSTNQPRAISDPMMLVRTRSSKKKNQRTSTKERKTEAASTVSSAAKESKEEPGVVVLLDDPEVDEEDSSLSDSSSILGDLQYPGTELSNHHDEPPEVNIKGFALLKNMVFWQQFLMLGLLAGIGLMTINNIGNDVRALWQRHDDTASPSFIHARQSLHVSILSFCSFCGRLVSGIGSDFIALRLNGSRFWCVVASAVLFCVAQFGAATIETPDYLGFVSGLTGFAYGMLFGVYPSLVANTFGTSGLSQTWGTITLAPVFTANVFNVIYGRVHDSHSIQTPEGGLECIEGLQCYSKAYWVTFAASFVGIALSLWSVRHERQVHKANEKSRQWSSLAGSFDNG